MAIKQESLFSIKWDLTTLKLLMNQFHSSKKISYSGYCRVRCDVSLIALGGKIPDVSYVVAKLTTFCLGRNPQMIQGVFHLPRNSGWDVNGTHVFWFVPLENFRNKWNF